MFALFFLVISATKCDIVLHSSVTKNGTIQSPLFPAPYPIRSLCRYEFQGDEKERVQVILIKKDQENVIKNIFSVL